MNFFFHHIIPHIRTARKCCCPCVCVCVCLPYATPVRVSFFRYCCLNATTNSTQFAPCLPDDAVILSSPVFEYMEFHLRISSGIPRGARALILLACRFMQCACGYTTKRPRRKGLRIAFPFQGTAVPWPLVRTVGIHFRTSRTKKQRTAARVRALSSS